MGCRRGLAMSILFVDLSVCLSVRLSVKRVICDKTKACARIRIPHERPFSLVCDKKNGWWGRPLLPKIFGQPVSERNRRFLNRYSLVAPQL